MSKKEDLKLLYGDGLENNPTLSSNHSTDRTGIGIVTTRVAKLGFEFRELPTGDLGIDGLIEIAVGGKGTGKLIACQIKTGKSFVEKGTKEYINFNEGDLKHYKYWLEYSLPVIIIIVDPDEECAYWQLFNKDKVELHEKSFSIEIPRVQKLGDDSIFNLNQLAQFRSEEEQKLLYLKQYKDTMLIILNEHKVEAEFEFVEDGKAVVNMYINDELVLNNGYFNYEKGKNPKKIIKTYFFWASTGDEVQTENKYRFKLLLNEIGEQYLLLTYKLSKVDFDK